MTRATTAWALRDGKPEKLATSAIDLEKDLEDWIVAEPGLLEPGLRILARQLRTASGPLDLLAVDTKERLVVIELKRAMAYRDAIAQVLDYASWVATQDAGDLLNEIKGSRELYNLTPAEPPAWDVDVPPRMLVAGTGADEALNRIIDHLTQHDLPINGVLFDVCESSGTKILVRSAVLSDDEVDTRSRSGRGGSEELLWVRADSAGTRAHVSDILGAWTQATGRKTRPETRYWTLPAKDRGRRTAARLYPNDDGGGPGGWFEFVINTVAEDVGKEKESLAVVLEGGWFPVESAVHAAKITDLIKRLYAEEVDGDGSEK